MTSLLDDEFVVDRVEREKYKKKDALADETKSPRSERDL